MIRENLFRQQDCEVHFEVLLFVALLSYLKNANKRFDIQPPKAIGRASHLPRRAHPVCQLAHTPAS